MTHLNEELFAHHNGRGNTKATLGLLVEAIRKLSADVALIKSKLDGNAPVVKQPTAKISPAEVVKALETKVAEVEADVKVDVQDLVKELGEVEDDVKSLVQNAFNEIDASKVVTPAPTAKKKTK
jgi:hypothetical protein